MGSPKLLECQFLIPIRRDAEISDGEPHDAEAWEWLENELMTHFEGWRVADGIQHGAWKSSSTGRVIMDNSRCYITALPKKRLNDLRKILQDACAVFAQQCIYLSVASIVEFVETEQ